VSVPFALPAAVSYGIADFAGGFAARRSPVLVVTVIAQVTGLLVLAPFVGLVPGVPSIAAFVPGVVAGLAGNAGLLLYMRGLAVGPMGVVAPLSAVVSAGLPLAAGVLAGERLGAVAVVAVAMGIVAIMLATAGTTSGTASRTGLLLGLAAGLGFGVFYVAIDAAPDDSGLWPLLAGRFVSTVLLGGLLVVRLRGAIGSGSWLRSAPVWLMVVSGACDTAANVLFLFATRVGDLGVSGVVVSLYPVVVVLLARVVLGERLTGLQLTGAGLALGASVLLAVN
jgi:drug/metabolite transporter (DMT)-like permease